MFILEIAVRSHSTLVSELTDFERSAPRTPALTAPITFL